MTLDVSIQERSKDSTGAIAKAARLFFSGTLLSRASGTLRDIAMAAAFGASPSVAAFMMAYRFAHLLRRVLGEGAFQSAFIPYYEEQRLKSPLQGAQFFRAVNCALSLVLLLIIASVAGFLYTLSWAYWASSPGNQEVIHLTILLLPSLFFICLYGLNSALLQCHRRYFISSVAPVAFNAIWIVGTLLLWGMPNSTAMPILSGVVLLACLGQWSVTCFSVQAILKAEQPTQVSINWKEARQQLYGLCTPLLLGIFGVAASQINSAIDALFARFADAEGPALLWYAIRIQQVPLALFGVALSGALMPPLSRAAKRSDWQHYEQLLSYSISRALHLLIPLTLLLLFAAPGAVQLIYGHGRFDHAAVIGTTQCLWGYAFGLLPMGLALLLAPAYYARGDYRWPSIVAFGIVAANIACNAVLIFGYGLGAQSVAWATAFGAWLNAIALSGPLNRSHVTKTLLLLGASLISGAIGAVLLSLWDHFLLGSVLWYELMLGNALVFPATLVEQGLLVIGETFAFALGYLGMIACLKQSIQRK